MELEHIMGYTRASSKVNTAVSYADGFKETCRTRWLLVKYAKRTGAPKLLVPIVLSMLITFSYYRRKHPTTNSKGAVNCCGSPISYTFCCSLRPEYSTWGPLFLGGTIRNPYIYAT